MKKILISLLFFSNTLRSRAPVVEPETVTPVTYPKGYFRDPLDIPIQLAANFGELRNNHFHMGFDIRTNQRENLPVYAAAGGYVSRIKVERSGFGHAIYITHPNGFTTLYAHLNQYYPALEAYVKNKQYHDEQWEQEISFSPDQFPVTKGQFIAFSGNTGASQGPHLHFEIRDTKTGNNLNPWLFDFTLPDKVAPVIYRLYAYDRRYSTYQSAPKTIAIKAAGKNYTARDAVVELSTPIVSFGIAAEDKTSTTGFRFGIYEASIAVDDSVLADFRLNNISYTDTRYVNGSIDYKTKASGGGYIQHLSRLPGNQSTIFSDAGDGKIILSDTEIHTAEIVVSDAAGNSSHLSFKFRWNPAITKDLVFAQNSIAMPPGQKNVYEDDDLRLEFSPRAFYDTVPFVHSFQQTNEPRVISAVHHLANYTIPVHDSFEVGIKPGIMPPDTLQERVVIQLVSNRKVEAEKGIWKDGFVYGKFRDLGNVKLLLDTIAPRLTPVGWTNGSSLRNKRSMTFVATDNNGELSTFNAYVDGQWILFSRKNNFFIHTFDQKIAPGSHEMRVVVTDIVGNTTEKIYRFSR